MIFFFCPQSYREGGASRSESNKTIASGNRPLIYVVRMVTWEELIQFGLFLVALISLVRQENNKKK